MSDIVLRSTARAHVKLTDLMQTLRTRLAEQEGQDTIEYLGVLLVVAAVIAVVIGFVNKSLLGDISGDVQNAIDSVFQKGK